MTGPILAPWCKMDLHRRWNYRRENGSAVMSQRADKGND
jgi:hypothetical protein